MDRLEFSITPAFKKKIYLSRKALKVDFIDKKKYYTELEKYKYI